LPIFDTFAKNFKMNSKVSFLLKNLVAFKAAFNGIAIALRSERNLRFHFLAVAVVSISGFLIGMTNLEWLMILILFAIVISMELINSAIERLCDLVQPEKDTQIGKIKDISAGAVLWTCFIAVIAALVLFVPKLINLLSLSNH
jgi:diacylglycerol kinase